jgi:DNA-binding XRE family transcriptional regulator
MLFFSILLLIYIKIGIMLPKSINKMQRIVGDRRTTLKITQEKLAAIAGVSLRTIREIEQGTGNPSLETADKLFEVLGVEMIFQIKNKSL